jgi:hypothetical protein
MRNSKMKIGTAAFLVLWRAQHSFLFPREHLTTNEHEETRRKEQEPRIKRMSRMRNSGAKIRSIPLGVFPGMQYSFPFEAGI